MRSEWWTGLLAGLTLANAPNFPQWTQIGAQAVLYGAVTPRADNRVDVGFRLYDPYRQCQLVSYQFTATAEQWRRIAHKISDVIYQRMTGETGLFDSRVVFVSESGTQLNRLSRLAISDQDGFNPVYLTQGDEIIMSPRFSLSDPNEITYVALGRDYSRIYLYNLSTGRRESLGEFDGQVLAPRFSNDGSKMAFSIIRGGNTDVYVMDLSSRQLRRLTSDPGIDTSPSYSPDGSQIVFESDRGGGQQLYVMNADGSNLHPISVNNVNEFDPTVLPDGRILLCKRNIEPRWGKWTLPAGFMELDETTAQGAARETDEEAGAQIEMGPLFSLLNVARVGQVHLFYRARLTSDQFEPGTETIEASVANDANVAPANLTLGAGVNAVANGNLFGGNNWFDTGDSVTPTLAESIAIKAPA